MFHNSLQPQQDLDPFSHLCRHDRQTDTRRYGDNSLRCHLMTSTDLRWCNQQLQLLETDVVVDVVVTSLFESEACPVRGVASTLSPAQSHLTSTTLTHQRATSQTLRRKPPASDERLSIYGDRNVKVTIVKVTIVKVTIVVLNYLNYFNI